MAHGISRISQPELFIGFVAPIGTDIRASINSFSAYFKAEGYNVVPLKVTEVFDKLSAYLTPKVKLAVTPEARRLETYIEYGNQLRATFDSDEILAAITITRIIQSRRKAKAPEKNVYLLYQFKRREEIDLLRSVYGRAFFQVSVYSRRGARVDNLSRRFAEGQNRGNHNTYRGAAEEIVQRDENESDEMHGQRVSRIFHDADVIVNSDKGEEDVDRQVRRFCDLLFGSNKLSPNRNEYGMFAAKAAALRTLDLSRQVGVAIFSSEGEIISMGSNEVPKAGGGTYWCDDTAGHDDRDYQRGYDANDKRKTQLLQELFELAGIRNVTKLLSDKRIQDSQFMDALEYGRIIHAEMSAICDAARLGRSLQDAVLFTTTFPCHLCAKHIVAAGIKKVVFLEPYPKSLAANLHSDSIIIEGADRGKYTTFDGVSFEHFDGVSPRRYRELFERGSRKKLGEFQEWMNNVKRPIVDLKFPFYLVLERSILESTTRSLANIKMPVTALENIQVPPLKDPRHVIAKKKSQKR
ncbi:anti-phage dCTP deaminase [Bradyrhizobium liaoningense]|uniref:anti-phage dCTP deaminase n=1 Tax=Bradyrhizobium liaoningense TaxID=43992 RepID=UPI001BA44E8C|nr:anti-phage dCTP deaminase [Bradyrhizobium liaoningense]MBR1167474.1 dCMP deaminase [Bradyrhizobium liaoningense]